MIIDKHQARLFLLGHHRLTGFHYGADAAGLAAMLTDLRCIQLDPLSPLGTSPDLVALARCADYRMGGLFEHLMPGHAFEHYAKERCLLPAHAYAYYRAYGAARMWPRLASWFHKSERKLSPEVLAAVLAEVVAHGPLTPSQMSDHGVVVPNDWSGWKGTAKATTLALELLWARCEVVVSGRKGREKVYDIPERAIGVSRTPGAGDFSHWSLLARVEAAGLLARNGGPHWSMIEDVRSSALPDQLIERGEIEDVTIEGVSGRFLAPKGLLERAFPECDEAMRVLGPLDALLWNRSLIHQVFGFEYLWEVYKPEAQRRWGWYVCPLLHRGQLVGRLEGRVDKDVLVIERLWQEPGLEVNRAALKQCMERHAAAMGAKRFKIPRSFR